MKNNRVFLSLSVLFLMGVSAVHLPPGLWAGDSASFVDLGFSPDGKFYMFAQYGVNTDTLKPWTELIVVDVTKNDYVPGGRIFYTHNKPIVAGQEGSGVMYNVIKENDGLIKLYGINHSNQGQPLYIVFRGDPAIEGKPISFRDFISGIRYEASLIETISGKNDKAASTFYIQLEITDSDGVNKKVNVGTPQLKRPLIFENRIDRVLISPQGNSLVFVIEMKR
jgi:predicted secreted protein